jgi:aryl-alcohol dehydrogenase-like predicted oxidoreductase
MKSLAISKRYGWARHVAHQAYYSLVAREFEWELMPLALDQKVGTVVWSPLGWGRLTGKIRRGQPLPETTRQHSALVNEMGPQVADDYLYRVVDALDAVAAETGIIGARNEEQLRQNLGAVGWNLTAGQVRKLDEASAVPVTYPYWHQKKFKSRNPFPTE